MLLICTREEKVIRIYQMVSIENEISLPTTKFGSELEKSIKESIAEKYEGKIDTEIGVVLAVTNIKEIGEGKILPGDPSIHYPVKFGLLTWAPKDHEIVEGQIIDITEFGAFVNVGALDGLVHVSQEKEKNKEKVIKCQKRPARVVED